MQALTGSTFATDDGRHHAGYIGYNERNETFNALYYVPQGDTPTCVEIFMGATLLPAHYARTVSRVLVLMGFYPELAENFATDFVTSVNQEGWGSVTNDFFGWYVNSWQTPAYKGVTIAQDDIWDCVPRDQGDQEPTEANYVLPLSPGWNMISFPGIPDDSAVSSVFTPSVIGIVLTYQEGEWLTSVSDGSGLIGSLSEVAPGYGYWLQTRTFDTLTIPMKSISESRPLVTDYVTLTDGWNLIGVLDSSLSPFGSRHSAGMTLDEYLGEALWGVAYTWSVDTEEWTKLLPGAGDVLSVGSGYWVWAGSEPPPNEPPAI